MNAVKKLVLTTATTLSLVTLSTVAVADNKVANNDRLASLIQSLPQTQAATSGLTPSSRAFSSLAPSSLVTSSFGETRPTQYFPANNQPSFFTGNINAKVQGLIAKAKTLIGLPYRFGGTSPVSGFDCSGFMQYIFKQTAGISLPRRSQDMAMSGHSVSKAELQAGDMVFFKTHGSGISHVGMYIGDNQFIHSPRTGKSIEISSLSGYYAKTYVTARRVLNENA